MIHEAIIENREIKFKHPKLLKYDLENYEGKRVSVSIKLWHSTRTLAQNRYYWLYLNLIERETGNPAEDMHEYFKRVFLKPEKMRVFDKEFYIPGSTTRLNKLEFSDYISKIERLTGIPAPDINNLDQLEEYITP